MALQTLKNINKTKPAQEGEGPKNFPAMLEQFKGEIARALPKHINPDRMARIALTAFRMTPKLAECDPRSVFAAVIQSSQMGLEVGLMGEAHLVPFGDQCQLIPGYTGLMKLARNTGDIQDIYAHEVRLNDSFTLKLGLDRSLEHEPMTAEGGFPASDEERGDIAGFYAVAVFKDGSRTFVALGRKEVEAIRDKSRGYQAAKRYKKESPWDTDFVAMGLKTAIRRLCKYLPKSPEMAAALALDAASEQGKDQRLDLNDVIEGSYAPVADEDDLVKPPSEKPEARKSPTREPVKEPTNAGTSKASHSPKESALNRVCAAIDGASSLEALDEVYVRAEGDLSGSDLDAALIAYRKRRESIKEEMADLKLV